MHRGLLSCVLMLGVCAAQSTQTAPSGQSTAPKTDKAASQSTTPATNGETRKTIPLALTRSQRLGAAKAAFIKQVEGSEIPANVITSSLEGWGRYTLVSAPDKADILIEITSPEEKGSSVTIKGAHTNPLTGYPDESTTTTRNISSAPIKMTVFDARTKLPLWSATEQPKRAMKQKSREDNLVEAAQALFSKFHAVVEPNTP
jgi:hypothetical protein